MLKTPLKDKHNIVFVGLILFYLMFFINLIMDARSSWSLCYLLVLLTAYSVIRARKVFVDRSVVIISMASLLLISTLEYFIFDSPSSTDPFFNKVSVDYVQQFAYIVIFSSIPFLFYSAQFKQKHFEQLIAVVLAFALIYNTYLNISFDFSRALLAAHFKSVILYDYCIAALSLVGLVFSFQYSKKWSFVLISLCLVNLSMIILHGSRGAWLGLPIALLCIALYFYKTRLAQTVFMLASSIVLTLMITYTPQSPIEERIEHLKSDTALIQQQQNYNSSVGTRIALWQFSWDQFQSSPWIGQGIRGFRNQICNPQHQDQVPNCQPHAHNMIFQSLASYGVIGLLYLILIYFYPLWIFIRKLFSHDSSDQSKYLTLAASIFMLYLGICSMSDYLFFFEFPTMFYFLMVITFLSLLQSHKHLSHS